MAASCEICGGTGWRTTSKTVRGVQVDAAERCSCVPAPHPITHRLSEQQLQQITAVAARGTKALAAIPFYPREEEARKVIARALVSMASSPEQIYWTVTTAISLFRKWDACGEAGLRQVFCSRWEPRDGLSCTYTDAFPGGAPVQGGQIHMELLEATGTPDLPALPEGARASADPEWDRLVVEAEQKKRIAGVPKPVWPVAVYESSGGEE